MDFCKTTGAVFVLCRETAESCPTGIGNEIARNPAFGIWTGDPIFQRDGLCDLPFDNGRAHLFPFWRDTHDNGCFHLTRNCKNSALFAQPAQNPLCFLINPRLCEVQALRRFFWCASDTHHVFGPFSFKITSRDMF